MPDPDHQTSWISAGARWSVTTDCASGQNPQDCEEEHNEAVAVLKVLHPEDE